MDPKRVLGEALAVEVMESALELSVPLKVDVKSGADWAET